MERDEAMRGKTGLVFEGFSRPQLQQVLEVLGLSLRALVSMPSVLGVEFLSLFST